MTNTFNSLESPTPKPTFSIDLSDGTQQQVTIIVVHRNRPAFLSVCLQTIYLMSNINNYEVVVVDNDSDQESQEFLDIIEAEGIKVIRNKKNEYWSKAANQGVAAADPRSKYFIFMHADTAVLDPSWIDVMVNLNERSNCGIVGMELGSYWLQRQQATFVHEWCMLVARQCLEDIGGWPEELPLVGMSFILTYRAQQKGYTPKVINNGLVKHFKSYCDDVSRYEQLSEEARGIAGKLMVASK